MRDAGVEAVLREIRERVRGEAQAPDPRREGHQDNGAPYQIQASGALARMRANLATTERTWSKLPPVTSFHRRGWKARLEIWVKRQFKRATSWYVYEQINFNAAANGALHDAAAVLEQSLTEQRVVLKQLTIEMSEQAIILDRARRAMQSRMDELSTRLEELHGLKSEIERLQRALESGRQSPQTETNN